jgi:hypothetical protein
VTEPQQDDLTDTDGLVQRTLNGPTPDDPDDQPPQNPDWRPEGTVTERPEGAV